MSMPQRRQGQVRMVHEAKLVADGERLLSKKRWKRQEITVQGNGKLIDEVFNA